MVDWRMITKLQEKFHPLYITEPHLGHGFFVQGVPLSCGTVCPQEEHLHIPPGPEPGLPACCSLPLTGPFLS